MAKIILGIHGLANKPEKGILAGWWKDSIKEGLAKNCDAQNVDFDFKLVYWADLLYKNPSHQDEAYSFDSLYNDQPYVKADETPERYEEGWADRARRLASKFAGASIDLLKEEFGVDSLADWVLEKTLKDLAFYYDEERKIADRSRPPEEAQARKVLQDDLTNAVVALEGQEIMLIAHSMGTIIAYDVLRDIGRAKPGFTVAEFITIGSPLGLPHVKAKIIEERDYDGSDAERVRTPSVVARKWVNYADKRDPVALDTHFADDYGPNRSGVQVEDDLVLNGYVSPSGEPNYHKSYGYLRAPEVSEHILNFLNQ